jgi:glucokinase
VTATIGVDVGGSKSLGVLVDGRGSVVGEQRVPTPRTADELLATIGDLVTSLRLGAPGCAVGVGVPGLVDADGVLRFAPNLPGVVEVPVRSALERRGMGPVVVGNDATGAAWAEFTLGSAAGARDVLMATIGTGIGGGLVLDGVLVRGHHGFAGEFGHMVVDPNGPRCPCGQRGCWERYASGSGLGWMAREAAQAGEAARVVELAGGDPEAVRGEHVTVAAAEGDLQAMAVMDRFAWWLAVGFANLATILDPEVIVLGGGMAEAGAVLLEPAQRAFASLLEGGPHRPPVRLVAARLGERAGAIGAALLARAA